MTWFRGSPARALAPIGRYGGGIILLDQVFQVVIAAGSFAPTDPAWRYQIALLISSRAAIIAVASLMIGVGVAIASVLSLKRGWAPVQVLASLVFLAAAASLLFDGETAQSSVASDAVAFFQAQRFRALTVGLAGAAAFAMFAVAGRRASAS